MQQTTCLALLALLTVPCAHGMPQQEGTCDANQCPVVDTLVTPSFLGCSKAKQPAITSMFAEASLLLKAAISFSNIEGDARSDRKGESLERWFGSPITVADAKEIGDIYKRMRGEIDVNCDKNEPFCKAGAAAFGLFDDESEIHICKDNFFQGDGLPLVPLDDERRKQPFNTNGGVVIHELTHNDSISGGGDDRITDNTEWCKTVEGPDCPGVYAWETTRRLAKEKPDLARKNAQNYMFFAEEAAWLEDDFARNAADLTEPELMPKPFDQGVLSGN